ncbi:MAG: hypothetical protein VX460_13435 [Planctomycetota bacterium]|nr:hypothetical protein [Planctomycetota bacterium]
MPAGWATWAEARTARRLVERPVAVLMGGCSGEREVSLTSGRAVLASLRSLSGVTAAIAPPVFEVEIDGDGAWCLDGAALTPQRLVEALPPETIYFLALHGGAGEDGTVQAFLETCGRAHPGAGPQTSSLCMDKHRSRLVAASAGVRVASGAFATRREIERGRAAALSRLRAVDAPVRFVKDVTGGSSIGVYRCTDDLTLVEAVDAIVAAGGDVLVEAEVAGLETTCGLIGDGGEAVALPIVEIEPREGAFFDLQQKYAAEGGAVETCPPRHLAPDLAARVQERARQAWEAFGGTGYARIDFMVPGERDGSGAWSFEQDAEPVMLEANTLPGFTPRSLLPLAAEAEGVGFRELCIELIARAGGV